MVPPSITEHSGLARDIQFGVLYIAKKYHFVKNRYEILILVTNIWPTSRYILDITDYGENAISTPILYLVRSTDPVIQYWLVMNSSALLRQEQSYSCTP